MGLRKRDGWRGEQVALDEANRIKEAREKYRQEHLHRPQAAPLIALNFAERDAARDVYQTMDAVQKGEYQRRTGEQWPLGGLNSAQVVDEIINAINLSRVKQAQEHNVSLTERRESNFG